jgi:L-asparaginase
MIPILFTGGTISMRHDAAAGGAVPKLSGEMILAATSGIRAVADIAPEDWGAFPGPHMTPDRQWELRGRVLELLAKPEVQGVVLTHGTDTLEETAYLFARSVPAGKAVVFTGAMRSGSDLGWDGPANLIDAVRVASAPDAGAYGTLLVIGARVFTGLDVQKTHTHMLDAFESPELGPVGVVDDGDVIFRRSLPGPPRTIAPEALAQPVDIVAAHAGADSRLLDASRATARGVVISALGRGNLPPAMLDGVERWLAEDKPVVIASRAQRGRVGATYGYPGAGRRLLELGAILAGGRHPQQARIDLMLGIGAGLSRDGLTEIFAG